MSAHQPHRRRQGKEGEVLAVGVDTHKESLAACAVNEVGRPVAERTFANDSRGHKVLRDWLKELPEPRRVGLEGAANFGAGLARVLLEADEDVREVPSILTRRERRRTGRHGKSDPIDALAIARVVARDEQLPPALPSRASEDLKALVDYRDQLISERTRVQNRLHADLQILAPGYRAKVRRLTTRPQRARAAELLSAAPGIRAELAGRRLERLEELDADVAILTRRIETAVRASGTRLVSIVGVGAITAAKLLGETGDPRRFRSMGGFAMACGAAPIPASSGQTNRHRLNRGGNRQLNRALHTIALVQARVDSRARTFVDRKQAEGKTWLESIRCLKRHLADVVYRRMVDDLVAGT